MGKDKGFWERWRGVSASGPGACPDARPTVADICADDPSSAAGLFEELALTAAAAFTADVAAAFALGVVDGDAFVFKVGGRTYRAFLEGVVVPGARGRWRVVPS